MPLYEYECTACHRRTEKIQKFSDPELSECPHCGGRLERTITAPAFQFAGGGWYKDLYSSAKPPASGDGKTGGDAKAGGSDAAAPASGSSGDSSAAPAAAAPAPAPAAPAASTPKSGS